MALTPEQVKEVKENLKKQIQNLPPEKRTEAESQIDAMSPEIIESGLKQEQTQKIFRLIIEKQIPSIQVDENSDSIAVLEIRPISEGHIIIIPKSPAETEKDLPKSSLDLAEKLSEKLKSSLGANSTLTKPQTLFGETIINIIPIYDKPLTLQSERTEKSPEELQETLKKINVIKKEKKIIKIKKKKSPRKKVLKLDRRIP